MSIQSHREGRPNCILFRVEDDYVAAASYIIERDYYPDLKRLRLQEEIVNAEREGKGRDQQVIYNIFSVIFLIP